MYSARAKGKVLLFGGYLVLRQPNEGLVLAVNPSISCTARLGSFDQNVKSECLGIRWINPRFQNGENGDGELYLFEIRAKRLLLKDSKGDFVTVVDRKGGIGGSMLHQWAIFNTFSYIIEALSNHASISIKEGQLIEITCDSDDEFYSKIHCSDKKTGLGSSASLVVSIVSCLIHYFGSIYGSKPFVFADVASSNSELPLKRVIHMLSEWIHTSSQGGIGSGFDIAAALYGSICFQRAKPWDKGMLFTNGDFSIFSCIRNYNMEWDGCIRRFDLPRSWKLVLAELSISHGTKTPGMAKRVMEFFSGHAKGQEYWNRLVECNVCIINLFTSIGSISTDSDTLTAPPLEVSSDMKERLKAACMSYRAVLKDISRELEEYPIEPEIISKLLDDTVENVPGIIMAGIPGAGGEDAIYCIIQDESVLPILDDFWRSWSVHFQNSQISIRSMGIIL
jgi:phosphomevalonate kinase